MRTSKAGAKGFTIVELLIVIVVIGILAAIVIVAYQGVTNKAKTSQYITDVTAIVKKSEFYNGLTNAYPLTAAGADALTASPQTAAGIALTALYNANADAKLPTSVAFYAVTPYTAGGPSYTQANTAIGTTAINYYFVSWCPTGKGMRIYYPDPSTSTVKFTDAGICP